VKGVKPKRYFKRARDDNRGYFTDQMRGAMSAIVSALARQPMTYTGIRAKIIELLEAISELAEVIDHELDSLTKYPAATVEAASHQDSFYDTAANRRAFSFPIRCSYLLSSGRD
jgi:hypothetical protein